MIVRSIVIEQVYEFQIVSFSTFVIVVIVSGSDLDGSGTEGHVDSDGVGDDGESTIEEGVFDEFTVEVLW